VHLRTKRRDIVVFEFVPDVLQLARANRGVRACKQNRIDQLRWATPTALASLLGFGWWEGIAERRHRVTVILDQRFRPQHRGLVVRFTNDFTAGMEPVCSLRQQRAGKSVPSKRVVKDFKLGRPRLIALWPKSSVFVGSDVQTKWDALKRSGCSVIELAISQLAKALRQSAGRHSHPVEFGDRTGIGEDDSR
jgi:hypothetical protein